ncbi:MAG: SbmA/BacA-like family transporter, partial [Alphaproteobacteria bacterium]
DVLLAPSLFAGTITLGLFMQIGNAFGRVYGSFTIFVDNWTTITELQSIHLRLKEFETNLKKYNK